MPTYEYECQSCHQRVEAVQRFTDPALTLCEHCGGELRKVFSAVGVVFKGSGFYKTDSRGAEKSSTTAHFDDPRGGVNDGVNVNAGRDTGLDVRDDIVVDHFERAIN
jgi:putative FmdB family regulatory protein